MGELAHMQTRGRALQEQARARSPGVILSVTVAMAATFLSEHYGAPVMLFALLLGMAFNYIDPRGLFMPGVTFTSRTILRIGVALLGARITAEQVLHLGLLPVALTVGGVTLTIFFGIFLSKLMGLSRDFGVLTGGAVGICGASAALAIASVLPKGDKGINERDTIFAVLGVTTLSTVAMVLYPIMARSFGLDALTSGIFIGATVHDVAQVVGAGYSISSEAGDAATVTKLLRVALLVPVVLAITLLLVPSDTKAGSRPKFPLFLIIFVVLVVVNSLGLIVSPLAKVMTGLSQWAMVAAIAALGIKTSLKELVNVGPKALVLIVAETLWILAIVLLVLGVSVRYST